MKYLTLIATSMLLFAACKPKEVENKIDMEKKVAEFATFKLTSSIDDLSAGQKEMLSIFFEVADIMDELFWMQAYGSKEDALALTKDEWTKKFIEINYGPWERLNDNKPFVAGVGEKPSGAGFYPVDMTTEEFEQFNASDKTSLYTLITRDEAGKLKSVPYHLAYKEKIEKASALLKKAATLAEDPGFKKYLELRSEALLTDDYFASDLAWMEMKTNRIDYVVGPIENYEDQLYGYKAAYEAYILLKDMEWSERLTRFAALLPVLQKRLPVEAKYKKETPGSESDLGAYDVVYYRGDCNAGSKTIAINLPNDPEVHKLKGSRRLQLKNAMQAKFDKIMVPIANEIIDSSQVQYVAFESFFENTMYHEAAHGIGVHHVITNDTLTVQKALQNKYSIIEEGKADIVGIFIIDELVRMGELSSDTRKNYVTFTAGIFRSIRFGASSAHGQANLVCYNYMSKMGAFSRNEQGIYTVDFEKMKIAVESLAAKILMLQGDGDLEKAQEFLSEYAKMNDALKADLERINSKNIPVDVVFDQGPQNLGLKACGGSEACCKSKNKPCDEKK